MRSALVILLLCALPVRAEIITSDRRYPWQGNVGISNGIPDSASKTVYQTAAAGASLATVQGYVNSCPANQVVELSAGSYTWTNDLDFGSAAAGMVLRGAGMGSTLITFSGSDEACFLIKRSMADAAFSVEADLSQNAVKGETSITLASVPAWVTVGDLIGIDELDESSFVEYNLQQTGQNYRSYTGNGNRNLGEFNRVLAKTATVITLERPLLYGYKTTQTAQIFQPGYDPSAADAKRGIGLEAFTVKTTFTPWATHRMVKWQGADSCYVKDVACTNAVDSGVFCYFGYRCEIRGSTFSGFRLTDAGQGYAFALYYYCTGWLIEDNIVSGAHIGGMGCSSSVGNVAAYNVSLPGAAVSGQVVAAGTHMCHSAYNLWEGNWHCDKVLFDITHGSGSHQTVFRNTVVATNGAGGDATSCVSIERYNRYCNIVGNILGKDGQQDKYLTYNGSTAEGSGGSILVMGGDENISDDYTPSDDYDYTSGMYVLVHGNWDTVQDQQTWESDVADHTLPDSLFRASKPSWFGFLTWPPFNPATGTATGIITNIPAGYRYVNGTNPPAGGGSPPASPSRLTVTGTGDIGTIH